MAEKPPCYIQSAIYILTCVCLKISHAQHVFIRELIMLTEKETSYIVSAKFNVADMTVFLIDLTYFLVTSVNDLRPQLILTKQLV